MRSNLAFVRKANAYERQKHHAMPQKKQDCEDERTSKEVLIAESRKTIDDQAICAEEIGK
jgi:hypothetical protein